MTTRKTTSLDLAALREQLPTEGQPYWRSLEELAQTEAFQEMLHREFPAEASEWANPVTRRQFLALAGASLALAGLSGCSPQAPHTKIVPYVRQPEQLVPGKPLFFATAMAVGGAVTGLLVESHMGRPTKVEGNPQHPASLGATDSFAQAAVLSLYDPDRSQQVRYLGRPRSWDETINELRQRIQRQQAEDRKGKGLRLVTPADVSPTLREQIVKIWTTTLPEAKWYQYEPVTDQNVVEGARRAFGEEVNTYYDLTNADVILSLDADFLWSGPAHLRYAHDFASRRKVYEKDAQGQPIQMNRLYVVEGTPSITGAAADHRLPLRTGLVEAFARAVALELRQRPGLNQRPLDEVAAGSGLPAEALAWVAPLVSDLVENKGRCVILAGSAQPPMVHALAHALNEVLGNVGQTVIHTGPLPIGAVGKWIRTGDTVLRELTEEMAAGQVEVLLLLGVNPAFTAPADVPFARTLLELSQKTDDQGQHLAYTAHLSLYNDETSHLCQWHLPEAHFLESWSDARNHDGSASIVQPLIAPLYNGKSMHELLEVFNEGTPRPGFQIVHDFWRAYWQARHPRDHSRGFETFWEQALHDGVVPGSKGDEKKAALKDGWARGRPAPESTVSSESLEIVFRPDATLYDGRFANNGWLQELPRPLTQITWDNALLISPNTADDLGLKMETPGRNGGEHGQMLVDLVNLTYQGRSVTFPAWIVPGHADNAITVYLGQGRTQAGKVGNTNGRHNAYHLRTTDAPWFDGGVRLERTGERFTIACTQGHFNMADRHLVREDTLEKYKNDRNFAQKLEADPGKGERLGRMPYSLYGDEDKYKEGHKWGMVVDLSSCIGCGACVIACQAENNIPVVGKEQVTRGREMHWLRVDRYYHGEPKDPRTFHQPVMCQQCENAPCEIVCPVAATTHSHDGLNDMVYNRCVGTRYCSNNCPYKVRRFNFLQYADYATQSLKLGRNPDVTVRSRGVMEKCTFCVQRIRQADIDSEKRLVRARAAVRDPDEEGVKQKLEEECRIRDGDVVTACQAACPARAIVFGDINDRESKVAALKNLPLNYGLLTDLNTRPRTTYLAAIRNPNPAMPRD